MSTCGNDRVTCLQLMPAYAERVRHMLDTSKNFQHAENLSTYSAYYDVCQHATMCFSMLLTYTKLTHNVFDVCQRIRQIFHTSAYANKSSRCDSGLALRCLVRLWFESSSRSLLIGYATWSSAIRCRAMHKLWTPTTRSAFVGISYLYVIETFCVRY